MYIICRCYNCRLTLVHNHPFTLKDEDWSEWSDEDRILNQIWIRHNKREKK